MSYLDRKQVPEPYLVNWPNEMHLTFSTEVVTQLGAAFDPEVPAPAKLEPLITAVTTAHQAEDDAYLLERKYEQTQQIVGADQTRDSLVRYVKQTLLMNERLDAIPAKKAAAQAMLPTWTQYEPDPSAAYADESTQLTQWYQAYSADAAQVAAAATLGLTETIQEMMTQSDLILTLIRQRDQEEGSRIAGQLKSAREQFDTAYAEFVLVYNAMIILSDDPHWCESLTIGLTQLQKDTQERYDQHRRTARRVVVQSDIVGKKLYEVTPSTTWERLTENYPKSLALSKDGLTVVSTDKKAKNLTLTVCHLGQPVQPSDVADVEKEYRLLDLAPDTI